MFGSNAYGQTAYADTQDEKMHGAVCERSDTISKRDTLAERSDPISNRDKNC